MTSRFALRHHAMMLTAAGALDYGLQILLPVILVRLLTQDDFGDYRLVWLIAGTGQAVFSFFAPQSLFYLLPRATPEAKRLIIGNTTVFLIVSGAVAGTALALVIPSLGASIQGLQRYSLAAPVFLCLWIAASLFDTLPTADGRAEWQAIGVIALAVGRVTILSMVAILTRDISSILWSMCLFAAMKMLLSQLYGFRVKGFRGLGTDSALAKAQFRYAFPFAISNGLFLLKGQADQWVVASSFLPAAFALISIASVALPISALIRGPVNSALLPRINTLLGNEELEQARSLLGRGYSSVALVLVPVLGLMFLTANELVEIVYTSRYLAAAPVMQIYLVGQVTTVFAAGHLLASINYGMQASVVSAGALGLSVALSLAGIRMFGIAGAAAGSVLSLFITEMWALIVAARAFGTSPSKLVDWSFSGRIVLVVVVAVAVAWLIRPVLGNVGALTRLVGETLLYLALVPTAMVALGIHRDALSLARDLRWHKRV